MDAAVELLALALLAELVHLALGRAVPCSSASGSRRARRRRRSSRGSGRAPPSCARRARGGAPPRGAAGCSSGEMRRAGRAHCRHVLAPRAPRSRSGAPRAVLAAFDAMNRLSSPTVGSPSWRSRRCQPAGDEERARSRSTSARVAPLRWQRSTARLAKLEARIPPPASAAGAGGGVLRRARQRRRPWRRRRRVAPSIDAVAEGTSRPARSSAVMESSTRAANVAVALGEVQKFGGVADAVGLDELEAHVEFVVVLLRTRGRGAAGRRGSKESARASPRTSLVAKPLPAAAARAHLLGQGRRRSYCGVELEQHLEVEERQLGRVVGGGRGARGRPGRRGGSGGAAPPEVGGVQPRQLRA